MASIIDDCKQEMEQTVAALQARALALRTVACDDRAPRGHHRRVLRRAHAAEPAGLALRARAAPARHPALRPQRDRRRSSARSSNPISGSTPVNDGKIIRIPIPELTEERRTRARASTSRRWPRSSACRRAAHRRDAIEMLKELHKEKELTDDDLKKSQERIEHLTKEYVEQDRQGAQVERRRDPGGLMVAIEKIACRATSPSSWTATAAGRPSAA